MAQPSRRRDALLTAGAGLVGELQRKRAVSSLALDAIFGHALDRYGIDSSLERVGRQGDGGNFASQLREIERVAGLAGGVDDLYAVGHELRFACELYAQAQVGLPGNADAFDGVARIS